MKIIRQLVLTIMGIVALSGAAYADCTSPAGVEGEQIYNIDHQIMQYCDGTDWTGMRGNDVTLENVTGADAPVSSSGIGKFVDGTDTNDAVYTTGNVGIGEADPTKLLHLYTNTDDGIRIIRNGWGTNSGIYMNNSSFNGLPSMEILGPSSRSVVLGVAGNGSADGFEVWTDPSDGSTPDTFAFGVFNDGDVGIGTRVPSYPLDVVGVVHASGGFDAGSAKVTNVADPTAAQDAATKAYVDSSVSSGGDNLGNHTATANIQLGTNYLSGDGGNEGIRIDADGKVGIGGPANSKFYVRQATDDMAGGLQLVNSAVNAAFGIYVDASGDTHFGGPASSPNAFIIDNLNGKIGFGKVPFSNMHLYGTTWTNFAVEAGTNDPSIQLTSDGSSATNDWVVRMDVSDADKFQWRYDNSVKMTIDTAGNVGIGTAGPSYPLDMAFTADSGLNVKNTGTNNSSVYIDAGTGAGGFLRFRQAGAEKYWLNVSNSGHLAFRPNGGAAEIVFNNAGYMDMTANKIVNVADPTAAQDAATKAYVDANAGGDNLGNHTATTNLNMSQKALMNVQRIMVDPSWSTSYDLWIQGGSGTSATGGDDRNLAILGHDEDSGDYLHINYDGEYAGGTRFDGNVGIGVTAPSQRLEVSGNILATAYYQSSDRNLKTNIETLNNPFEILSAIEGKHFEWKEDGKPAFGVIAQDVETVMPEAVATNKDTGIKSVEYTQLIAPLIEAVKQLETRVKVLEAENQALKNADQGAE